MKLVNESPKVILKLHLKFRNVMAKCNKVLTGGKKVSDGLIYSSTISGQSAAIYLLLHKAGTVLLTRLFLYYDFYFHVQV